MHTAPVLAVLVCHNGQRWLPRALAALRESTVRPSRIVAVDTGSADDTARLLADAASGENPIINDRVTLPADTGFAAAVAAGVDHASEVAEPDGDSVEWIWVLHDDCAVDPHCLAALLNAADASPSAGILGPIALDWDEPRLVVEAGLTTDAAGHRRADAGLSSMPVSGGERGQAITAEQSSEVLATPSAAALVRRKLWDDLGGFDTDLPLLREDLDLGWRANRAGWTVLCVPTGRVHHARAVTTGQREPAALDAAGYAGSAVADRVHGVRTYLVNCSRIAFLLGVPRLAVLAVVRSVVFLLLAKPRRARAELAAGAVPFRLATLRAARRVRACADTGRRVPSVRGLFAGRWQRVRGAARGAVTAMVRRKVAGDLARNQAAEPEAMRRVTALGTLAATPSRSEWVPPDQPMSAARPLTVRGPDGGRSRELLAVPVPASPADADTGVADGSETATGGGERTAVATGEGAAPAREGQAADATARPSPGRGADRPELVFVEVRRARVLAATLLAPPVLLVLALTALAVVLHFDRLAGELVGGRLLPVGDLGEVWSAYLASWHPAGGGTSAHAPPALAVLGILGAPLYPVGGPSLVVTAVLLLSAPLAGLSAYLATRRLPVARWVRAALAVGYALLPPALAAVEQGRVGVVVAHLLLPPVVAGIATVLRPSLAGDPAATRWLPRSVTVAVGLAVLGAFAPLTHLAVLVGLLVGFVVVPSSARMARRISSMAVVALLPIALLLPWPVTLITDPELIVHGIGAGVPEVPAHAGLLLSLHPGGPGALPVGGFLLAAALVALVLRPTLRAAAGLGALMLGGAGLALLQAVPVPPAEGGQARHAWAGEPLLMIAIGLLLILLTAAWRVPRRGQASADQGQAVDDPRPRHGPLSRGLAVGTAVGLLAVFVLGAVIPAGEGPLRPAETARLAPSVAAELADSGESVLVLRADGDPPRQAAGGMPAFGDGDLPLPEGTPERLLDWQRALIGGPERPRGTEQEVRDAMTAARAAGVLMIVLPHGVPADGLLAAGGDLVTSAAPTADGRHVVRLTPVGGQVTLIAPELSRRAVDGQPPPAEVAGDGVAVVDARLPDVRARVSDGAAGRLLVLAATYDAGWRAAIDGEQAPIVQAWGHQVAVEVPTREAEVVVEHPGTTRTLLLLAQLGAVLFSVLTAIPPRPGRAGHAGNPARAGSGPRKHRAA
ncbi:glycosyltransferase family 2 protein [Haloechinothrix sp. LS1_15]|uniref:glycosyltransferase family 2 protein n=1 Tax=Haloechinothrix sp. LS1_15 TaxID=2652248 RepID=UPI0029447C82|nr:glycosyltransferase family 2 protein [Haloechinothrix sp. LS1_15]MDV6011559.1 glycosyltransferase family 2 protein [Haloechinothrix sp. LS1_15]